MSLDLTNNDSYFEAAFSRKKSPGESRKEPSPKMEKSEEEQEYPDDFDEFSSEEVDEETNRRRRMEMNTILSMYQQTLNELNSEGFGGSNNSSKFKGKYLVMSEIKEQSNEGGSMISRNE